MRLRHAQVLHAGTNHTLVTGSGRLAYVCARETTGTATAGFDLIDGDTTSDRIIYTANLAANESIRDWFLPCGLPYNTNITFNLRSGSATIVTYFAADFEWEQYEAQLLGLAQAAR